MFVIVVRMNWDRSSIADESLVFVVPYRKVPSEIPTAEQMVESVVVDTLVSSAET